MEGARTSPSVRDSRLCGGCYLDVLVDNGVLSSEVRCKSCTTKIELAKDSGIVSAAYLGDAATVTGCFLMEQLYCWTSTAWGPRTWCSGSLWHHKIINLDCSSELSSHAVSAKYLLASGTTCKLNSEGHSKSYAPWCPACKALQPLWEDFASWSEDLDIRIGQVDVTTSPGLSGRFVVTALPTIFHVLNGEFRQYRGARDKEAFISFIEDEKWKSVDPIPSWQSPASIQMSIVSYFFKLSQILRMVHNKLMEEYGLPTWGSYLIFAIATIIIGAIFGLLLVCIIDLIYPPKPMESRTADQDMAKREFHDHKKSEGAGDDVVEGEEEEEEEEEVSQEDLVDEAEAPSHSGSEVEPEGEGSPSLRKRRARKAD